MNVMKRKSNPIGKRTINRLYIYIYIYKGLTDISLEISTFIYNLLHDRQ